MTEKKMEITYQSGNETIKLSPSIVQQFVTKGNAQITAEESVNFMQLAKYQHLNPFLNEIYLVKFGSNPAQMIVSKEAFMKRAEANEHFRGFQAGIMVERKGELVKLDGAVKLPQDKLIGGWAQVIRDDRDVPTAVEISLSEFGKGQSTWKSMPNNMIRKTAIVNALREAFPNSLGALYTDEEVQDNKPAEHKQVEAVTQDVDSFINQEPEEPEEQQSGEPEQIETEPVEEAQDDDETSRETEETAKETDIFGVPTNA